MSSNSSSFHIPFPRSFLAVNTPVNKSTSGSNNDFTTPESQPPPSAFLSNRPSGHQARASISSIGSSGISDAGHSSPPSSPPSKAADSPVLGPKIFSPLAVNTKHAFPPQESLKAMSPVESGGFLSNRH